MFDPGYFVLIKAGGAMSLKKGRRRRTLVGSKERPMGKGAGSEPRMGRSLPCEDREEETPKEWQL